MHLKERDLHEACTFVITLGVIFIALYFALLPLVPWWQRVVAQTIQVSLQWVGVDSTLVESPFVGLNANGKDIEISFACLGLVEFLLLAGAMIASRGFSNEHKVKGIVFGALGLFVFNEFRIVFSILTILNSPVEFAEIVHGVLFRAFLFIVLAGFYRAWVNNAPKGPVAA